MKPMKNRVWSLGLLILLVLVGVGIFLADYFCSADQWAAHPANERIRRSILLTDRDGYVLRDLRNNSYCPRSEAFVHWVGDLSGNVPVWVLSGWPKAKEEYDIVNGLYHYGGGKVLRLTLQYHMQLAAMDAMGDNRGTLAMFNYRTGELLCAVSAPSFDPGGADSVKDGMYMNRFLHGTYTPGSVFKILTAAAALEQLDMESWQYTCNGTACYGKDTVSCSRRHGKLNLQKALQYSCNCAFGALTLQLEAERMQAYLDRSSILLPYELDGIRTAAGHGELKDLSAGSLAWSGCGQYRDLINPCSFLAYIGAVANGGIPVRMHLIAGQQTEKMKALMSENTAKILQSYLRKNVLEQYSQEGIEDFAVHAKTGTAEVSGRKPNALLAGFLTDPEYPYAFLIVAENAGSGKNVCMPILVKLLQALKTDPPA